MKYYYIICETCFCGERGDFLYATNNEEDLYHFAASCADENAMEWYDGASLEEEGMDEDEYFGSVSYSIKEITAEEYAKYNSEGVECGRWV